MGPGNRFAGPGENSSAVTVAAAFSTRLVEATARLDAARSGLDRAGCPLGDCKRPVEVAGYSTIWLVWERTANELNLGRHRRLRAALVVVVEAVAGARDWEAVIEPEPQGHLGTGSG